MRIAGKNIPSEKRILIALQYIHGVGPLRSKLILEKAKITVTTRTKDLTLDQEELLRKTLADFGYVVESDLRREVIGNIKHLQEIGTYRGFRHRKKLPVRGQSTKSNSRTKRGKKMAIAGKKKVTK